MNLERVSAIIFDLGGVILNIDYNKTSQAFKALGMTNFDELYSQAKQSNLFDDFETGSMSEFQFRNEIRSISGMDLLDEDIDNAWNAMLLDMPLERIEFLEALSKSKPLYLLSNTNEIHVKRFEADMKVQGLFDRFTCVFQNYYYSSSLGQRKPDAAAFMHVCTQNDLEPSKTLFIDDSVQHIHGAKEIGLQAVHLNTSKSDIIQLFS